MILTLQITPVFPSHLPPQLLSSEISQITEPTASSAGAPHISASTPTPTRKQTLRGYIGLIGVLFLIGAVSGFLQGDSDFAGSWKPGAIFAFAGLIGVVLAAGSYRVAQRFGLPKLVQSMGAFGLAFSAMHAATEILNNRFDTVLSKSTEGLCLGIVCGAALYGAQKRGWIPIVDPNAGKNPQPPKS